MHNEVYASLVTQTLTLTQFGHDPSSRDLRDFVADRVPFRVWVSGRRCSRTAKHRCEGVRVMVFLAKVKYRQAHGT